MHRLLLVPAPHDKCRNTQLITVAACSIEIPFRSVCTCCHFCYWNAADQNNGFVQTSQPTVAAAIRMFTTVLSWMDDMVPVKDSSDPTDEPTPDTSSFPIPTFQINLALKKLERCGISLPVLLCIWQLWFSPLHQVFCGKWKKCFQENLKGTLIGKLYGSISRCPSTLPCSINQILPSASLDDTLQLCFGTPGVQICIQPRHLFCRSDSKVWICPTVSRYRRERERVT